MQKVNKHHTVHLRAKSNLFYSLFLYIIKLYILVNVLYWALFNSLKCVEFSRTPVEMCSGVKGRTQFCAGNESKSLKGKHISLTLLYLLTEPLFSSWCIKV